MDLSSLESGMLEVWLFLYMLNIHDASFATYTVLVSGVALQLAFDINGSILSDDFY